MSGIVVRPVQPGEDSAVWNVAKTLSIVERYYYYYLTYRRHAAEALVAIDEDRIIGCVIPLVTTIAGEKSGIVGGIFVDRRAQGKGAGKALAEAALLRFQAEGCESCYVLVDRYNSSSWNMFLHKGFRLFEHNRQLKMFGSKIISLWWAIGYFFEPGTFILRKNSGENDNMGELGESSHFFLAWLGSISVMLISFYNPDRSASLLPAAFFISVPVVIGVTGVSILAHEISHKLVASFFGLKTVFKIWESGMIFSALLALLGVTFYPSYGSTFISQKDWPYDRHMQKMGLIYAAGPAVSLLVALVFLGLAYKGEQTGLEWLLAIGHTGLIFNCILVLFNLIPIFPFTIFDGNKIFQWNKPVWAMLVTSFILLAILIVLG